MSWNTWIEFARSPIAVDLAKTTLVFAAAAAVLFLTRRRSAHLRYTVAAAGLILGASIPMVERLLPAVPVEAAFLRPAETTHAAVATKSLPTAAAVVPSRESATAPSFDPARVAALLWLAGAALLLVRRARGLASIQRTTTRAAKAPRLEELAHRIGAELGVRDVEVRTCDTVAVPLTWGFRRARVLLPSAATTWPESRLRAVLVHELVHVRRRDYWVQWAVEIARSVYWFHPLAWWLAGRSSVECELACDDAVVRSGVRPVNYARTLLDVARAARRPLATEGLAVARPRGLTDRVERILDPRHHRGRETGTTCILMGVLIAVTASAAPWSAAASSTADAPDVRDRQHAAWTLGEREDVAAVGELIALTGDESPDVRAVAAWSLGEIKDLGALPALYALLDDPDLYVREMTVRAIGEHEHAGSLDVLERELRSPEPGLRVAAAWALGEIPSARSVELLLPAAADRDPAVRAQALLTLARFDLGVVPTRVLPAIHDPDARVRTAACRLFGSIGDPGTVDVLLRALRDPDRDVRAAATWALDEVNPSRR